MATLLLSRSEVEQLLPLAECIEAVQDGFLALARGELMRRLAVSYPRIKRLGVRMVDGLLVLLVVAFFGLSWGFVRLCEKL